MSNPSPQIRDALAVKLRNEGREDLASRLEKCGRPLTLRCEACTSPVETFTRCDLKWCPSCQRALAARTADRYGRIMAHIRWPLFVTLTAHHERHDAMTLRDHRRAWGKLRRLRWFRNHVRGGVVAWEITTGASGHHVHAHGLFDCRWLAVSKTAPRVGASRAEWLRAVRAAAIEVSEQWSLCCGREANMKVRRVWSRDGGEIRDALVEVVKYACKGSDLVEVESAGAIIDQLDGCRLITSFGTCFGKPEFKRQRSAPRMCECGCTAWLPEAVLIAQSRDEHGLTRSQRTRHR